MDDGAALGMLQVDGDGVLAAVPAEEARQLAEGVALERLDFDHARAQVAQLHRRVGAGDIGCQVDDRDAVERTGQFSPRLTVPACDSSATFRLERHPALSPHGGEGSSAPLLPPSPLWGEGRGEGGSRRAAEVPDDQLAVELGIAVKGLEGLRPLEVQVQIVLPGEADAAVHLYGVAAHL